MLDDRSRFALVKIESAHPGVTGPGVQFHLVDHLGNCNMVVDSASALVNREEFTRYGKTSFGSFSMQIYHFTGMERDEEI